jgi:tetratricopeptide (TPR) repeat protein
VIELYSIPQVAKIFGLTASRLRYWIQSGFLTPSLRRGGRYLYSFADLIQVKAAVELIAAGTPAAEVRRALISLRDQLPMTLPRGGLRIRGAGDHIAVSAAEHGEVGDPIAFACAFSTTSLAEQIEAALGEPAPAAACEPAPEPIEERATEPHDQPSAFHCFAHACQAEEAGRDDLAEIFYERCLALEDGFAAVHTNLGNLYFRRGDGAAARRAYERALELEPEQIEARYNLGNLLDEDGETELAIAELRRVVARAPEFADAHFNLGVILARVGGVTQARGHFLHYLELDEDSSWSGRAREYLEALTEAPVASA